MAEEMIVRDQDCQISLASYPQTLTFSLLPMIYHGQARHTLFGWRLQCKSVEGRFIYIYIYSLPQPWHSWRQPTIEKGNSSTSYVCICIGSFSNSLKATPILVGHVTITCGTGPGNLPQDIWLASRSKESKRSDRGSGRHITVIPRMKENYDIRSISSESVDDQPARPPFDVVHSLISPSSPHMSG
jgi:hypothetical protein